MKMFVNINGKIISAGTPVLKTSNRAFCYGDGLFETIRWHNQKILFFNDHLNRLLNGMKFLKMEIPKNFSADFFKKQVAQLISKNNIDGDARLRLQVYRNQGGYYTPKDNSVSYAISAEKLNSHNYVLNKKGLRVGVFNELAKSINQLSNYKTCSSIIYTLAGIYTVENKLDDSLILNTNGNIVDAISSNIFFVIENKIFTPPLSDGCVDGVMRKNILRILKKEKITFQEKYLSEEDLLNANELFFTNAIQGIQWVGKFSGKTYKNKISKSIYKKLLQLVG
ncbi:MAG: aminotransferase class IV [Bacteroidia bacterium]